MSGLVDGALLNTAQLEDKTWFIVLLVLGLLSFGLVAMIAYVIGGPDGTGPARSESRRTAATSVAVMPPSNLTARSCGEAVRLGGRTAPIGGTCEGQSCRSSNRVRDAATPAYGRVEGGVDHHLSAIWREAETIEQRAPGGQLPPAETSPFVRASPQRRRFLTGHWIGRGRAASVRVREAETRRTRFRAQSWRRTVRRAAWSTGAGPVAGEGRAASSARRSCR